MQHRFVILVTSNKFLTIILVISLWLLWWETFRDQFQQVSCRILDFLGINWWSDITFWAWANCPIKSSLQTSWNNPMFGTALTIAADLLVWRFIALTIAADLLVWQFIIVRLMQRIVPWYGAQRKSDAWHYAKITQAPPGTHTRVHPSVKVVKYLAFRGRTWWVCEFL